MSQLADVIRAECPDWGPLPDELLRAFEWMSARGYEGANGDTVFAAPYAGSAQLGAVFSSGLSLEGWFDPETASRLLPIVESNGAGGVIAMWNDPSLAPGEAKPFVLIDDMVHARIAASAVDLLRLVAVGYDELLEFNLGDEPDPESAEAHREFREWVSSTFDVDVPEVWDPPEEDDFTVWSETQRGVG